MISTFFYFDRKLREIRLGCIRYKSRGVRQEYSWAQFSTKIVILICHRYCPLSFDLDDHRFSLCFRYF
jgi:hypothetical protein